jgi:hypothetical protein
MLMFSSCSGECAVCNAEGGCLAGHGDDDFSPATKEQLINRLNNNKYPSYRQLMIDTLKRSFNVIYCGAGQ